MKEYYCTICGRQHNGKHSSTLCRKHQLQMLKYGKTLDNNPRSKYDPNEFILIGDNLVKFYTYEEPTFKRNGTFIIDAEDYPLVSKYHWRKHKGYAFTSIKRMFLHRLLTNALPGQQVDHINLDITDNRKSNLRIANNSLNFSNRRPYNIYGIKGIEYHKKQDKWSAYFRINNKQYHSPCYKTKEEAAFARYILEQMFREEKLTQFSEDLINTLSQEQKICIIEGVKKKFNKE